MLNNIKKMILNLQFFYYAIHRLTYRAKKRKLNYRDVLREYKCIRKQNLFKSSELKNLCKKFHDCSIPIKIILTFDFEKLEKFKKDPNRNFSENILFV